MTMPKRYPLSPVHRYDKDHDASVFKDYFKALAGESSADAETRIVANFTALGDSGTLTFNGTNGTDYEFTTDGFRTKTATGAGKLIVSDILTGKEMEYLAWSGMSIGFRLKTSEWVCPQPSPTTPYTNPVPDMNGTASSGTWLYLMMFYQNNTNISWETRTKNDSVYQTFGTNKLQFTPNKTTGNPNTCSRPISNYNKGEFIDVMMTTHDGVGNYWIDGIPAVPPAGSGETVYTGERRTRKSASNQFQYTHTANDAFIVLGTYGPTGNASFCGRFISHLRLFKTQVDMAVQPKLRTITAYGDSLSGPFGFQPDASGTDVSIGDGGAVGGALATNHSDFADIEPMLRFSQVMIQNGYQIGGMYSAGQGGYHMSSVAPTATSLAVKGHQATLIDKYYPSMVFTMMPNNDIALVASGAISVAAFKAEIMDNMIAPLMARGNTHGWGFIIIPPNKAAITSDNGVSWGLVADMLLALPADFDAAYPSYAGKVKVKDIRTTFGEDHDNNRNWRSYFTSDWGTPDDVHPSRYGEVLQADAMAEMALEWVRE